MCWCATDGVGKYPNVALLREGGPAMIPLAGDRRPSQAAGEAPCISYTGYHYFSRIFAESPCIAM